MPPPPGLCRVRQGRGATKTRTITNKKRGKKQKAQQRSKDLLVRALVAVGFRAADDAVGARGAGMCSNFGDNGGVLVLELQRRA